jgi:hypothetical protein
MLSLSFGGGCICARDYAITQAMFYLSLIYHKKRGVCCVEEWC